MRLEIFTLCDAATDSVGKLNILGSFDTLWAREAPVSHPAVTEGNSVSSVLAHFSDPNTYDTTAEFTATRRAPSRARCGLPGSKKAITASG